MVIGNVKTKHHFDYLYYSIFFLSVHKKASLLKRLFSQQSQITIMSIKVSYLLLNINRKNFYCVKLKNSLFKEINYFDTGKQ